MRRCLTPYLIAAAFLACAGCGNPDAPSVSGSLEEATVKGTVTLRGKPVTNGEISFRASNINRPNAPAKNAPIGKDGTYTANVFIGENMVEVSCKELATRKNMELQENIRPAKIGAGEQTLDVEISSMAPIESK